MCIRDSSNSEQTRNTWQFNIRGLLLVTAEVAAFLALAKLVLPKNFRWCDMLPALQEMQIWELTPLVITATVLPAVFLGIHSRRTWRGYLLMGLYFWIPASLLSLLN